MIWSNVGDEPGRIKLPTVVKAPRGVAVRARGRILATVGATRPETSTARAERLRKIARGER